jgi:two-component system nitrogen regulation response regulator GlnG
MATIAFVRKKMQKPLVWIVDDDNAIRWVLEKALANAHINSQSFARASDVLEKLLDYPPQVLISDIRMPGLSGLDLLKQVHEIHPELPVIIITAYSDLDSAVSAYQGGAFEYLAKPFDIDEAVELVQRALNQSKKSEKKHAPAVIHPHKLIGSAPAMQEVFRIIGRLSRSHITVLIMGESGTGKELVAQALHQHSPRADKPFIALNTAAIPKDLLESELFGHERGAFTGAAQQRKGRFEQADGGTLFLDEIGDMPPELQTRLLRVLADGCFFRVGGYQSIQVDVRIIAATHQNLEQQVKAGKFREDLFHRLNVIRLQIPPLRQRCEDIGTLMHYFLKSCAAELKTEAKTLSLETERYLSQLPWRGNVRQLENTCRWLTVMATTQQIRIEDLPPDLQQRPSDETLGWEQALQQWAKQCLQRGEVDALGEAKTRVEKLLIDVALDYTHGHKQAAAKLLGLGRNTLARKIKIL